MKTFYYTIILVLFYSINVYAGIVVVPKEEKPKIEKKKPVKMTQLLKKSVKKIINDNYPDFRSCLILLEEKVNMVK